MSIADFARRQQTWSEETFGPGNRINGLTAHILKELLEVRESAEAEELADIIILAVDGMWRLGCSPEQIEEVLLGKQDKNTTRKYDKPKDANTPAEAGDRVGKRWKPTQAIFDVVRERQDQVEKRGWLPEHDDSHTDGSIARAAATYAQFAGETDQYRENSEPVTPYTWPWNEDDWRPKTRRDDLVRAAALCIAEIERLDREEERERAKEEAA